MRNRIHWTVRGQIRSRFASSILILFLTLILSSCKDKPVAPANLPAYPAAGFEWVYNESDLTLIDPQGTPRYTLTADGTAWQPLVSPGLRGLLPPIIQVTQNPAGEWEIIDSNGKIYQVWDAETLSWKSEAALNLTEQASVLTDTIFLPTGQAANPIETPTALQPTSSEPVISPTAPATTETISASASTPAAGACSAPVPSRLTAGDTARVALSLNLRKSPEIGNNIIRALEIGEFVTVVAGPTCVPQDASAYLWWKVTGADNLTGWAAEATLTGSGYYLEPAP